MKRNYSSRKPLSRRSFVAGTVLAASSVALGGHTLWGTSRTALGASDEWGLPVARLSPAGGGDYPAVQAGDPSLAHPLEETFDEFQPLRLDEDGGVRVVTPFYSVYIPNDLFPDGFVVDYSPAFSSNEYCAQQRGYDLAIHPVQPDGSHINVWVATTNWAGIQGSGIALSVGPVAADNSFHVIIEGWCDRLSDPYEEQARRDIYPYYKLVSPYIVAARAKNGTWEVVEVVQTFPKISEVDGVSMLTVPGYCVSLDPAIWQNGLLYRFYDELVPVEKSSESGLSTLGTMSNFLALFSNDDETLLCWVFTYDGEEGDLPRSKRFYIQQAIGEASDDSKSIVYLAVPLRDVSGENARRIEEATLRAESDMEGYASTVGAR